MVTTTDIQAALSNIDTAFGVRKTITAPKAYATHLAAKAQIETISRQHAKAIKSAPGYSAAMGCFLSPKDEVAFIERMRAEAVEPAFKMAAE